MNKTINFLLSLHAKLYNYTFHVFFLTLYLFFLMYLNPGAIHLWAIFGIGSWFYLLKKISGTQAFKKIYNKPELSTLVALNLCLLIGPLSIFMILWINNKLARKYPARH